MDQTELQSPEVNTRKINLGTIKIQLLGVIGTDLHIIEITGELPEQHTDRFIEESQKPDLSQYNLATSQDSKKTPLQERLEEYLEQERKNYPELDQYIKNKEWNNQQYDLSLSTSNIYKYTNYMEITPPDEKAYNKWIKEEKEKERNEETREMLQDNKFINAWEIIKEANKSEQWTNFDTYKECITQTEKQLAAQILKAKEYFAKELIRIIVKNWQYEYPRKQFEETEENITDLMIKEHDNFELSDLRARIKLAKTECLQHYLSTLKIR
ncbi:34152_t:CDS:2 [Gigaspora margarita]|uniref:34152_t:CDS:1 n=1 Tax=Gigaspora margarita TaxID=4874 RepID=A0ABN7VVV5_GIGMA|nr:34152_t:CDS:2 [Gigaspora margarita]